MTFGPLLTTCLRETTKNKAVRVIVLSFEFSYTPRVVFPNGSSKLYFPSIKLDVSKVTVPQHCCTWYWRCSKSLSSLSESQQMVQVRTTSHLNSGCETKKGMSVLQTTTPFSPDWSSEGGALDRRALPLPRFMTFELLHSGFSAISHWLWL